MNVLTKEQANEMRDIIRKAIRSAAIHYDKELWRTLKRFKIDYTKSVTKNVSLFLSTCYLNGFIDECKRNKKYNNPYFEDSDEYTIMYYIITLYIYFMQVDALFVDNIQEFFLGGVKKRDRFLKLATNKVDLRNETYQYELDDSIINYIESHKFLMYLNAPFMLIGRDENLLIISTMEFIKNSKSGTVTYNITAIDMESERIEDMIVHTSTMQNIIFKDIKSPVTNKSYILPIGGFMIINFFNEITKIKKSTDIDEYKFHIQYVDSASISRIEKTNHKDKSINYLYNVANSYTIIIMQYAYACHSAFEYYRNRTPKVKKVYNYISKMTSESKEQLYKDYPVINKFEYTKYEYIDEFGNTVSHVSKGGTHASPCQHTRRATMRLNKKTGIRDIYVKGSIVNKDGPKTKYYKSE